MNLLRFEHLYPVNRFRNSCRLAYHPGAWLLAILCSLFLCDVTLAQEDAIAGVAEVLEEAAVEKFRIRIVEFETKTALDPDVTGEQLLEEIKVRSEVGKLKILKIVRMTCAPESKSRISTERKIPIVINDKNEFLAVGVTAAVQVGQDRRIGKWVVSVEYQHERLAEDDDTADRSQVISTNIQTTLPLKLAKPQFVAGTGSTTQLLIIVDR